MTQISRAPAYSMSQFDRLPVEIKLRIFMEVDVRSLVILRSISRDWNRMITDSASLQHKIELAVSGVGQAPPKTCQTRELSKRTDILRDHRAAWLNLVCHDFRTIPAAPVLHPRSRSTVLLRENVFAQKGRADPNIYLTRIPSRRLATTDWETWTVTEDTNCNDFTMDPSQNLLVLMDTSTSSAECGAVEVPVHLRSLETGGTHPLVRKDTLYVSFDSSPQYGLRCEGQIIGNYLGVFYSDDQTPGFKRTIIVWNWKTGDKILEIVSTSFFSFTFIDETYVLVASDDHCIEEDPLQDDHICAPVWVYDLTNHSSSRTHLTDGTYCCAFLLPQSLWVETIFVRCNPSSLHQSVLSVSSKEDLPDSIITICEYCQVEEDSQLDEAPDDDVDAEAVVQIFVPASRIKARISAATPGQRFSWNEWGPTDAQIELDARPYFMETRIDTVSGMRAVDHFVDFSELYVYDFDPLRVSRCFHGTDEDGITSNVARKKYWGKRVEQMFPYSDGRVHDSTKELAGLCTTLELPEKLPNLYFLEWNSLITDDAVMILNVDKPDLIHVFRF